MPWIIEWDVRAKKELEKLDRSIQINLINYLETRIALSDDPTCFGKALMYDKKGWWRYRVEDHRIICKISHENKSIKILAIGNRKEIYN